VAGRYLGLHPRANVSMMSMRPPQHGHGRASAGGSAASADLGSSGIASGFGTFSNARALVEAFRQDVYQEAADELICRKCHELVLLGTLDPVVHVFERDVHRVSCDQAAIGDGDDACSARGTRDGFGPAERLLRIDHPFRSPERDEGDSLHWTGRDQTWNYQCASCHSTDLKKNYDLAADTYATSWSDVNVACEACHGPGSRHIAWAEARAAEGSGPSQAEQKRQPEKGQMGVQTFLEFLPIQKFASVNMVAVKRQIEAA
jgi:cytochrome c554/c'-like protein